MDGDHHLKADGPNGSLVLHSAPIALTNMPGADQPPLKDKIDAYLTARTAYDAWIASNPDAFGSPQKTALTAAVAALVAEVNLNLARFPGASAPNIGVKARHGQQAGPITGRSNAAIPGDIVWQTRSEHVLPFHEGSTAWTALALLRPERNGTADRYQTTIITYQGAADLKDEWDNDMIDRAKAQVPEQLEGLRSAYESGGVSPQALLEGYRRSVIASLGAAVGPAVDRTMVGIETENRAVDASISPSTHGQRRGNEPPTPDRSKVAEAAAEQLADVTLLFNQAVDARLDQFEQEDPATHT